MKEELWQLRKIDDSFISATKNMKFDEGLLHNLNLMERIERFYIWKNPGITYSYKQKCPVEMLSLDHSGRITGGGIVFHSPGDLVFSIASSNNDPIFPKKSKDKLLLISKRIQHAFQAANINLDHNKPLIEQDYNFCQSYPTPFEIIYKGNKICGLTIRQFKTNWLIQGVIHTKPTHELFFPHVAKSNRIKSNLDTNQLLEILSHL